MIMDKSRICCSHFADLLCNQKDRGIAVTPFYTTRHGLSFHLSFRSLSAEDSHHVIGISEVKVCSRLTVAIKHCPWCGVRLSEFYAHCSEVLPIIKIEDEDFVKPDRMFGLIDTAEDVTLS